MIAQESASSPSPSGEAPAVEQGNGEDANIAKSSANGADLKLKENVSDLEEQTLLRCKPVSVAWKRLSVTVQAKIVKDGKKSKEPKTILQETSGFVQASGFLAVMGPSGSGKTTLVDILANRKKNATFEGDVLFAGQKLKVKDRRAVVSYVAQEDTLLGQFTVRETLAFAAKFHYGLSLSREELSKIIVEAMETMGLSAEEHTLVGDLFRKGLSGGQKRRLSIAVELVSRPSVIILDEPTSGLDSASSFSVLKFLRQLAAVGHTIITTIHQPSSELFASFDKLMIMSKGHTIYLGDADKAVPYYASLGHICPAATNPADYLISVVNTDFHDFEDRGNPAELGAKFLESVLRRTIMEEIENAQSTNASLSRSKTLKRFPFMENFIILSHRNILDNFRNPGIYWVRLAMYVLLCLLMGVTYLNIGDEFDAESINSRVSMVFFISAFLIFMTVAAVPFFMIQRATFARERANGAYSTPSYVLSQYFCSAPGIFIIALLSSACSVLPARLNGFGYFVATLFVSLWTAESFVIFISSVVPHFVIGLALAAGAFGFFMIVQGFFIVYSAMPAYIQWAYYIAFHSYAFRAFMWNEFHSIESFDSPQFPTGESVLVFYDMEDVKIGQSILIVWFFGVAFQILFGVSLWALHTGKR